MRTSHTCAKLVGRPVLPLAMLLVTAVSVARAAESPREPATRAPTTFEEYATVEAYCDGVPVYSLGNITYIYGVSPDLSPNSVMQEGNGHPKAKIRPKKSWEISSNFFGAYPAQPSVRTMWNDSQPLLPIHLIDGDPDTAWCSYGAFAPDLRPEWIRIDLPEERKVSSVVLVCSQRFAMGGSTAVTADSSKREEQKIKDWMGFHRWAGRALPGQLQVEVSRDAWHWETVYENRDFAGDEGGSTVVGFEPRLAKQIRITGHHFKRLLDKYVGYAFSLGEVQVRDVDGNNVALVSRGAGVTASSTSYLMNQDRLTHDACYAPVLYDLGLKWVVICSDAGLQGWHNVERTRDKLEVDPAFDRMITDLNRRGLKVIMGVDVKANPVYLGRKLDWRQARYREINNDYYDFPGWVFDYPALWDAYVRYVDFVARHFKGRVAFYTFAADVPASANQDFFAAVMGTIKKVDPDVGVVGGETRHFFPGSSIVAGRLRAVGRTMMIREGVKLHQAKVAVETQGDGEEVGLLLRYADSRNYIAASLRPKERVLKIQEVVNGQPRPEANTASFDGLGPNIRMSAELKESRIAMSVSDGKKAATAEHEIRHFQGAGAVGLMRVPAMEPIYVAAPGCAAQPQYVGMFDNFIATDGEGKLIFKDSFDGSAECAAGWQMVEGRWLADVSQEQRAIIPTMTTAGGALQSRVDAGGTWQELEAFFPAARQHVGALRDVGYEGLFNYWIMTWSAYPPGPAEPGQPEYTVVNDGSGYADFRYWCDSEMMRAKYVAQTFVGCAGLNVLALYCNPYFSSCSVGQSLFRCPSPGKTITPMQPDAGYYTLRTISTVLDGWKGAGFEVTFGGGRTVERFTFRRGDDERMVAAWIPGKRANGGGESKSSVTLPGFKAQKAWVIDVLNGTEQELDFTVDGNETVLPGILIKDYPTLIRTGH